MELLNKGYLGEKISDLILEIVPFPCKKWVSDELVMSPLFGGNFILILIALDNEQFSLSGVWR